MPNPARGVVLPPLYRTPSPNQSPRGDKIRGIVIHETQGSFAGAVSWLRNPAAQASAHLVLTEHGGRAAPLVPWGRTACHAPGANPYTIGLELAGTEADRNTDAQLRRAARITAFWCQEFAVPPRQGDMVGAGGIVRHQELGWFGGGHSDPGGFDWGVFLARVKFEAKRARFRPVWGDY